MSTPGLMIKFNGVSDLDVIDKNWRMLMVHTTKINFFGLNSNYFPNHKYENDTLLLIIPSFWPFLFTYYFF